MAVFKTEEVSGIASATKFIRFPLGSSGDTETYEENAWLDVEGVYKEHVITSREVVEIGSGDLKLMSKLGNAKIGSGHDCYLKSITVHFEIEAGHSWWLQALRYHFWDVISSSSKMHSITKGSIADKCSKWVNRHTIGMVDSLINIYNNYEEQNLKDYCWCDFGDNIPQSKSELFECIIDNTPLGYQLKAGMVTNYLQLKTIYAQRKNHKLSAWNKDFVEWIDTLPLNHLIRGCDVK